MHRVYMGHTSAVAFVQWNDKDALYTFTKHTDDSTTWPASYRHFQMNFVLSISCIFSKFNERFLSVQFYKKKQKKKKKQGKYWFMHWLSAEQATLHCLKQWWLRSMTPFGIAGPLIIGSQFLTTQRFCDKKKFRLLLNVDIWASYELFKYRICTYSGPSIRIFKSYTACTIVQYITLNIN